MNRSGTANLSSVDDAQPVGSRAARELVGAVARGATSRSAWERLLLDAPPERAERAMLLSREARGGWFPLVASGPGEALVVGNALAGTGAALATAGFRVTLLDPSAERLALARARLAAAGARGRFVVAGDGRRLPFADDAFDLVVQEGGAPSPATGWSHDPAELLRLARVEVVLIADNRLGYKRSAGARGEFRVPTPLSWIRAAVRPARGERTLVGYRELLEAAGFGRPRALALYPHADDFTHVVALDELLPQLQVGPLERRNRLKLAAEAVGLFPVLTPSFAILVARREHAHRTQRIERVLEHLAHTTGERVPRAEELIATRGNKIVVQTRRRNVTEEETEGRWTLHVPLSPAARACSERHVAALSELERRFPEVPVPQPLFAGEVDGLWVACERRLPGVTSPHLPPDPDVSLRIVRSAARHLEELVVAPPAPLAEAPFEELVGAPIARVAAHAEVPSTLRELERLRDLARERLLGRPLPLVHAHGDLRGKHVQVREDGAVVGFLDWGVSQPSGLPVFDLLHLVVHQRKQEADLSAREAWHLLLRPAGARDGLRPPEREAILEHAAQVGVEPDVLAVLQLLYPVLVADVAERSWDYSRPRWLHRHFGL